ncbi:MAG: hypothetical protein FJY97_06640 [candidate division Zixibacteria bacterium]|nr:hypothetical protein [candidate division Zixibacteria bacterium]
MFAVSFSEKPAQQSVGDPRHNGRVEMCADADAIDTHDIDSVTDPFYRLADFLVGMVCRGVSPGGREIGGMIPSTPPAIAFTGSRNEPGDSPGARLMLSDA